MTIGFYQILTSKQTVAHSICPVMPAVMDSITYRMEVVLKAELLLEGIFFALNFLPWKFLLIEKLEIEKTKTT